MMMMMMMPSSFSPSPSHSFSRTTPPREKNKRQRRSQSSSPHSYFMYLFRLSLLSLSLSLYFLTSNYLSQTLVCVKENAEFRFPKPLKKKKKLDKKSFRVAFEKRGTWLNELFDDVSGKTKEEKQTRKARVFLR